MSDDQTITADEFADWIRCPEAITRLNREHRNDAAQDIWLRLKSGKIRSAACVFSIEGHPDIIEYFIISKRYWTAFKGDIYQSSFWRTSNVDIGMFYPQLVATVTNHFIDVRFHPHDLAAIPGFNPIRPFVSDAGKAGSDSGQQETQAPADQAPRHAGGRPTKDFWDDLLIEIFRRIHFAELTPKKQSDIVTAMLDWAVENGHELGETAAKGRARKLFDALREKVEN